MKKKQPLRLICQYCRKTYLGHPQSNFRNRKYCCHACATKDQSDKTRKTIICQYCNKKFYTSEYRIKHGKKFCSQKCYALSLIKKRKAICINCGKEYETRAGILRYRKHNYCSPECKKIYTSQRKCVCEFCGKEFCRKPNRTKNGRGRFCSITCSNRWHSGKKSGVWKGGSTDKNQAFRAGIPYLNWRKKVIARDAFTCQKCGLKAEAGDGILLHSHHIKSFKDYPELRLDVSNGISLCVNCHEKEHGRRFRKHFRGREQTRALAKLPCFMIGGPI